MRPTRHPPRARFPRRALASLLGLSVVVAPLAACSDDGTDSAGPATTAPSTTTRPAPPPGAPNVVLVLLDDLDALTMPFWEAMPRTRARLVETGTTFTNAFVTSPECCPSRATVLTGNYPHNTGIYDATPPDGGYQTFAAADGAERDTVATRLHDAGYQTAFVGKYLNGYEQDYDEIPPGWDHWFGVGKGFSAGYDYDANHDGEIVRRGSAPEDYLTDVFAEVAGDEVARTEEDDDRPFFLSLWTSAPHDAIPAAPRHADHPFADAELPRRANFDEPDVSDKSTWLREGQRRLTDRDLNDLTTRYRKMMGSLYAVDELIDGLLAQLDEQGELANTLVIFTSDNGYNFGAHRLPHKMAPYEESIRIPLVIAGPGVPEGENDSLVLTNDLAPTILDAAGLPAEDLDGRPLQQILDDPTAPWRSDFLVEYHGTYHELNTVHTYDDVLAGIPGRQAMPPDERPLAFIPSFRAVRSEQWLLVEWYAGDVHEYELYDLDADPFQLTNLLADPAEAARRQVLVDELQARIDHLATCQAATCRE